MTSNFLCKNKIIVHNLPIGTEFGIDYNSWYVGPRFCGLAAIPVGFHFIFTSAVNKEEQHSPRNGQFLVLSEADGELEDGLYQASWDDGNEELVEFKMLQRSLSGVVCVNVVKNVAANVVVSSKILFNALSL